MRKNITIATTLFIMALVLSGCAKTDTQNADEQQEQTDQTQQQDLGYINNMIGIKEKAAQDVADATTKENQKIADALEQSESGSDSAVQYSSAILHTTSGDITIKFYTQDAPKTVANFIKLASSNFYDKTTFHRVIKGFMVQGGDPNSKDSDKSNDGRGGPGYTVPAEIKLKNVRGSVATARLGDQVNPKKESSGSQFFINTVDNVSLDGQYTVFGTVTSGMDTIDKIENSQTDPVDNPLTSITIKSVELVK